MSWYSKKDVLNDIAHVTGSSAKELDEQYIVVGEQPPPVRTTIEVDDDEFLLRCEGLESKAPAGKRQIPDLTGITEMLRMVDEIQDPLKECLDQKEVKDGNDTIIIISKLNPNVPVFIPRNTALRDITDKLKEKISSPSVETCFQKKTERNLAIATLLKLYSDNPANGETSEKKLKLLTPQDFEKSCLIKKKTVNDSQTSLQMLLKQEDIENTAEDIKGTNDKLIEESVLKVQSWLNEDETQSPKEASLYLGPITFKKKENVKPATPSSNSSADKIHEKKIGSYVPSEYANKLTETYMDRNKIRDEQNGNIWTKLERELKAKDKVIKEKMKLQGKNVNQSTV